MNWKKVGMAGPRAERETHGVKQDGAEDEKQGRKSRTDQETDDKA